MNKDRRHGEKTAVLRDFLRSGGTIRTLDQIREMFGYANRSGAKLFLGRLVKEGLLEFRDRSYFPTPLITGLPLFESVRAGLPFTPSQEESRNVELDRFLIDHPNSTFLVRVKGDSMKDAGIVEGDIAIVDRSRSPKNGDIVIASIAGDATIKYFRRDGDTVLFVPANEAYKPIAADADTEILGVVTGTIRKYA